MIVQLREGCRESSKVRHHDIQRIWNLDDHLWECGTCIHEWTDRRQLRHLTPEIECERVRESSEMLDGEL